jgi:MSHA pilin protein MshA
VRAFSIKVANTRASIGVNNTGGVIKKEIQKMGKRSQNVHFPLSGYMIFEMNRYDIFIGVTVPDTQGHRSPQCGFTLIELVMVIVILGVLAAVALPKFVDLSDDAQAAATLAFAGAISSASSANYAARMANALNGQAVGQCSDGGLLLQGGLPSDYSLQLGIGPTIIPPDVTQSCTVYGPKGTSAVAKVTGIR